eukprot:9500029-Pyramimonas_sp.AAC.1
MVRPSSDLGAPRACKLIARSKSSQEVRPWTAPVALHALARKKCQCAIKRACWTCHGTCPGTCMRMCQGTCLRKFTRAGLLSFCEVAPRRTCQAICHVRAHVISGGEAMYVKLCHGTRHVACLGTCQG